MKKTVIFDMDGLMIDSERVTFECYREVLAVWDRSMSVEFYKKILGTTYGVTAKMLAEEYGDAFDAKAAIGEVHKMMARRFEEEGVPEKRGLRELLEYLKGKGFKMIVATSSSRSRVDTILAQSDLAGYFDSSICGDEVVNGKPDPEIFLKACRKAGCNPAEAYVLEDSEAGIEAAFAAGIDCVAVPDFKYPKGETAQKARWIVSDLNDVIELFERKEQYGQAGHIEGFG